MKNENNTIYKGMKRMHAYSLDVEKDDYSECMDNYQVILLHENKFTKEEFFKHVSRAKEYYIEKHEDRILQVTGEKKIPVSVREIVKNMINLFHYRILNVEVGLMIDEIYKYPDYYNVLTFNEKNLVEGYKQYSI
jgi:hypothetical protein